MAFAARFKGTCRKCAKPVEVGQLISWARKGDSKGEVYHVDCATPDAIITEMPVTPASDELAMLKAKLAELEHSTRIVSPSAETVSPVTPVISFDSEAVADFISHLKSGSVPDELTMLKAKLAALEAKPETPRSGDYDIQPLRDRMPVSTETITPSTPGTKPAKTSKLTKSSEWYEVFAGVLPFTSRILLIGPPSSGKSTTAMLTAKIQHRITMTETTSREDLIGMFHLIDSQTKWVDGPITSAMRHGQPVLIDEIDRYSPECASLLYSIIDDKPHISLPSGELVSAATGYKVIMTSNEGLETLPPAVQDRIEVIILAKTPHKDAVTDLPTAQSAVVMRYYLSLPVPEVRLKPSVRRMRAFHNLVNNGIPSEIAAKLVFGQQGGPEVLSVITSSEGTTPSTLRLLSEYVKAYIARNEKINAIKQLRAETGMGLAEAKTVIDAAMRGY